MPYREKLDNGLILRAIENEQDISSFIEFNSKYNSPQEGATCNIFLRAFPGVRSEEFQLVEDEKTGSIVSTTCLLPWLCDFGGITLKAAMLEMVLSHPEYRKSGLVRLQINRFLKLVDEGGYDLSIIWGIPYYYRQFGYTYCINGNSADILMADKITDAADMQGNAYNLRKASLDDIPELMLHYDKAAENLTCHVKRDEAFWRYLIRDAQMPFWLVINGSKGISEGYAVFNRDQSETANITENGIASRDAAIAVLQLLKREGKKKLAISWPENGTLVTLARSYGSIPQQPEQWLIRIRHIPDFLNKIGPVLEKRLASSEFGGLTSDIVINLFKQAYVLRFADGKLKEAEGIGFKDSSMGSDGGDICIPTDAFVRLAFGFRTLEQLADAWPDIVVKPSSRKLIETLFPVMTSYINAPIGYWGSL